MTVTRVIRMKGNDHKNGMQKLVLEQIKKGLKHAQTIADAIGVERYRVNVHLSRLCRAGKIKSRKCSTDNRMREYVLVK